MSRIGHNVPLEGFEHVTKMLKESAGEDGIISRDDAEKLGKTLRKDGRGTEAYAAGKVYRMVDKFEDAPGARVTGSDLDQARLRRKRAARERRRERQRLLAVGASKRCP